MFCKLSEDKTLLLFSLSAVAFQNAMRATVESHESKPTLPPIKVLVALGHEDLSIRVSEVAEGGHQLAALTICAMPVSNSPHLCIEAKSSALEVWD